MTVEDLIIYGKKYIHKELAKMLLSDLLNLNSLELLHHLNDIVEIEIIDEYKNQVYLVSNKKPIQYVIGNVNFYGYKMKINENVLIPRFETEELVEKTINYINNYFDFTPKIVDLGTGSGCIAITLSKKLNTSIDAVDISEQALEIARENNQLNDSDVNFYLGDMLEPLTKKYDVIISNPPYISYDEQIMDIVKNNEPANALYADNNGLKYYQEIIKKSKNYLNNKNILAFEIGEKQALEIQKIALEEYPNSQIKIEKDLQGRDRFIFIFNNI